MINISERQFMETMRELMEHVVIPRVREQLTRDLDRRIERIVQEQLYRINPALVMDIGL